MYDQNTTNGFQSQFTATRTITIVISFGSVVVVTAFKSGIIPAIGMALILVGMLRQGSY